MFHGFLRQATAAQSRAIGPYLDETDGFTAETGLTVANTDILVSINGAATAAKTAGGGTHRANGVYGVTWDATDTATVGQLTFTSKVAGARQVFGWYSVVEEAIYDAFYVASATGKLPATIAAGDLAANSLTASALATDAVTEIAAGAVAELAAGVLGGGMFVEAKDVSGGVAITPSDTVNLSPVPLRGVLVVTTGDVKMALINGDIYTFASVPAYAVLPPALRVFSTGTTATTLVALL